jgi:hypothetical protein
MPLTSLSFSLSLAYTQTKQTKKMLLPGISSVMPFNCFHLTTSMPRKNRGKTKYVDINAGSEEWRESEIEVKVEGEGENG